MPRIKACVLCRYILILPGWPSLPLVIDEANSFFPTLAKKKISQVFGRRVSHWTADTGSRDTGYGQPKCRIIPTKGSRSFGSRRRQARFVSTSKPPPKKIELSWCCPVSDRGIRCSKQADRHLRGLQAPEVQKALRVCFRARHRRRGH